MILHRTKGCHFINLYGFEHDDRIFTLVWDSFESIYYVRETEKLRQRTATLTKNTRFSLFTEAARYFITLAHVYQVYSVHSMQCYRCSNGRCKDLERRENLMKIIEESNHDKTV